MKKIAYLLLITSIIGCNRNQNNTSKKDDTKSLTIQQTQISQDESDFFNYKPDIRIFTVLAFVNAGGYEPFNLDSISEERKEIRLYLDSVVSDSLKKEIKDICKPMKSHRFIIPQIQLALNLTYPPNFKWLPDSLKAKPGPKKFKDEEKYLKLLNEFYLRADIPKLWGKYSPAFESNNLKYSQFGSQAINNITEFCRVDSSFYEKKYGKFNFYEEELANKGWGSIFSSKDTVFYFMNYQADGEAAFYHESLHLLINAITDKYSELLKTKKEIVTIASDKRFKLGLYIALNDLFSECMVTTLDFTLREKYNNYSREVIVNNLEKEYKRGLILVPYFYNSLKEYQGSDLTIEQYYPRIIDGIDVDMEKAQWKEYVENKNSIANRIAGSASN